MRIRSIGIKMIDKSFIKMILKNVLFFQPPRRHKNRHRSSRTKRVPLFFQLWEKSPEMQSYDRRYTPIQP